MGAEWCDGMGAIYLEEVAEEAAELAQFLQLDENEEKKLLLWASAFQQSATQETIPHQESSDNFSSSVKRKGQHSLEITPVSTNCSFDEDDHDQNLETDCEDWDRKRIRWASNLESIIEYVQEPTQFDAEQAPLLNIFQDRHEDSQDSDDEGAAEHEELEAETKQPNNICKSGQRLCHRW